MADKYLGAQIIPALRKKYDDKIDKATYDAKLEEVTNALRAMTATQGWPLDWTLRAAKGMMNAWNYVGNALMNRSVSFGDDSYRSISDYSFTYLAWLMNNCNVGKTNMTITPTYRRMQADGVTYIDSSWQAADPTKAIVVEDGTYITFQTGVANNLASSQYFKVGEFWSPGFVPLLDEYPKLYNSLHSGDYWPLPDPIYSAVTVDTGKYDQTANLYWRTRYKIDKSACTDASGFIAVFGLVMQQVVGGTSAYTGGYGFNFRIV